MYAAQAYHGASSSSRICVSTSPATNVWYWSKRQGLDPRQAINGITNPYYYAPDSHLLGRCNRNVLILLNDEYYENEQHTENNGRCFLGSSVLLSGCIKETFPESGYATSDQTAESPFAKEGLITAMPTVLITNYTDLGEHIDFGYPGIFGATDRMVGEVFPVSGNLPAATSTTTAGGMALPATRPDWRKRLGVPVHSTPTITSFIFIGPMRPSTSQTRAKAQRR